MEDLGKIKNQINRAGAVKLRQKVRIKMRKITLKHDMQIPGYGTLKEGTPFKVEKFNKRFVYVKLSNSTLRLARKSDCNVVY